MTALRPSIVPFRRPHAREAPDPHHEPCDYNCICVER